MIKIQVRDLFRTVEHLHQLELYDDLCLYIELHFPTEPVKIVENSDELEDDQKGYIFCCLADAYANIGYFSKALQNYEIALQYMNSIKHSKSKNDYKHIMNSSEIRFRMHKIFLQNRQEQQALHCLELINRTEQTPKVLFAMAQLCQQLAKNNRRIDASNTKTVNYLKILSKDVPEAVYCKSWLLSLGAIKQTISTSCASNIKTLQHTAGTIENCTTATSTVLPIEFVITPELRVWMEVKHLQSQKCFMEAAKLLGKLSTEPNLRFLLEQAYLYRIGGDYQNAIACYQQAHLLDCTNAEGMDALAALLSTHPNSNSHKTQRELDQLAVKIHGTNPRRPESFVIFGWAARQCHRAAEARQFMLRAEQLARKRGRQRCEVLLLKAQLLLDTKRNYKEMDMVLADALHNDCINTTVYALYIQMYMAQKRYTEAQRMARTSMKFVGEQNYQMRFLLAQTLADEPSNETATEHAIVVLEKMVNDCHLISMDPLLLLSRLYERYQKYDKAIALLNRFKESYADPRIHQELGGLLAKTNRSMEACDEYGQAVAAIATGSGLPGSATKDKIINMMSSFTTPAQSVVNAVFEHSGTVAELGTNGNSLGVQTNVNPRTRPQIAMRMPPPVARVTRRTTVNQHEQLRRLRGLSTYSATSLPGSNMASRTQMRRMATRGATTAASRLAAAVGTTNESVDNTNSDNNNSSNGLMLLGSGRQLFFDSMSTVSPHRYSSSPLQRNDERGVDEEEEIEGDGNESSAEASDDLSSQLSLEESGIEDIGTANRNRASLRNNQQIAAQLQHGSISSSFVDQSRGASSNGSGRASTPGRNSDPHQATIVRHMVRDIQRYFATTTQAVTDAAIASTTTTTNTSTNFGTTPTQIPSLQVQQNSAVNAVGQNNVAITTTSCVASNSIITSTPVNQQPITVASRGQELSFTPLHNGKIMATSSGATESTDVSTTRTTDSRSLLPEVQMMDTEPSMVGDTSSMSIDDSVATIDNEEVLAEEHEDEEIG